MKKLLMFSVIALFFLLGTSNAWLMGYDYRAPVEINISSSEDNLQIPINVTYSSKMSPDFTDINITDENDTPLPFWIEETENGSWAKIWVKGNWSSSNGTQAYIYYNSTNDNNGGNGTLTFNFFDDFSTLDTDTWEVVAGSITTSNGWAVGNAAGDNRFQTKQAFSPPFVLGYKMFVFNSSTTGYIGMRNNSNANTVRAAGILYGKTTGANKWATLAYDTSWVVNNFGDRPDTTNYTAYVNYTNSDVEITICSDIGCNETNMGSSTTTNPIFADLTNRESDTDYTKTDWVFTAKYSTAKVSYTIGSEEKWFYSTTFSMDSNIIELETSEFILSIEKRNTNYTFPNATLYWNGTALYTDTTPSVNGNITTFSYTYTIPQINDYNASVPVWWDFYYNDTGTGTIGNDASSNLTQTIYKIVVDDCSFASNVAINFTLKNEKTRGSMNGNLTMALYYGLNGGQFNKSYDNVSYAQVCLYPNFIETNITGHVIYKSENYTTRNYYLNNYTADSVTDTIILSLLQDSYSFEMPFTVYDESNEELEDAYILLERWYPESMSYQSVAMGKTDSNGLTVIPLERGGDAWYRITVTYNYEVVKTESKKQFYTSESSYTLIATVGVADIYYDFLSHVSYTWNWTGDVLYLSVTDSSGSNPSGQLLGWETSFFKTSTPFCNSTGSGNSFTLVCDASGKTGQASFTGKITYNGQDFVILETSKFFGTTATNYGNIGLLATAFLIGVSALAMVYNPAVSIITALIGFFGAWVIGIVSAQVTAVLSIMFVGILIVYLMWRDRT